MISDYKIHAVLQEVMSYMLKQSSDMILVLGLGWSILLEWMISCASNKACLFVVHLQTQMNSPKRMFFSDNSTFSLHTCSLFI